MNLGKFILIKIIFWRLMMEEEIKLISNIYAVERFYNTFRVYLKILAPGLVITIFLCFISLRPKILMSGILEPYRSYLLIAITISAVLFSPYILYILFIEKKWKWILSFFVFVVIPFVLAYMIFQKFFFSMMGVFLPILFYGIYCYLLKTEVQSWLIRDNSRSRYGKIQGSIEAEIDKREIERRERYK